MTERIKELAEQAGWHDYKQFATFNRIYQWQDFDKEKFAELIVKECIETVENSHGDTDFAIWKMKKDFGVNDEL